MMGVLNIFASDGLPLAGAGVTFFACAKKVTKETHPACAISGRSLISVRKSRSDTPSRRGITKNRILAVFPLTKGNRAQRFRWGPVETARLRLRRFLPGTHLETKNCHLEWSDGPYVFNKILESLFRRSRRRAVSIGAPCERQTRFPSSEGKNARMHFLAAPSPDGELRRLWLQEKSQRLGEASSGVPFFFGSFLFGQAKRNARLPGEGKPNRFSDTEFTEEKI